MGSKLAQLAKVIAATAILVATPALADEVDDLLRAGSQAYADGHYDEAITKLKRAYELSPKAEIVFALAQAERLGGACKDAIGHYKKVLESITDLETSRLVQGNIALCEKAIGVESPPDKPPPDKPPDKPAEPPTKTIVRVERKTDVLAASCATIGAVGLGASFGLFLASSATRDAAASARTLDDNHTLNDRATTQRGLAYVAGGVGIGLLGFAVFRWVTGSSEEPATAVSVSHADSVTTWSVLGRW